MRGGARGKTVWACTGRIERRAAAGQHSPTTPNLTPPLVLFSHRAACVFHLAAACHRLDTTPPFRTRPAFTYLSHSTFWRARVGTGRTSTVGATLTLCMVYCYLPVEQQRLYHTTSLCRLSRLYLRRAYASAPPGLLQHTHSVRCSIPVGSQTALLLTQQRQPPSPTNTVLRTATHRLWRCHGIYCLDYLTQNKNFFFFFFFFVNTLHAHAARRVRRSSTITFYWSVG